MGLQVPQYRSKERLPSSTNPFMSNVGPTPVDQARVSAGQMLSLRANQLKKEQDLVTVMNTVSAFSDQEREFLVGQKQKQGSEARDTYQSGLDFYAEKSTEFSDTLENDNQKRLFAELINNRRNTGLNALSSHQAVQHQAEKKSAIETTKATLASDIMAGAVSATDLEDRLTQFDQELDSLYPGFDHSGEKLTTHTAAMKAFLDRQALRNPEAVGVLAERWKDKLSADDIAAAVKLAKKGMSDKKVDAIYTQLLETGGENYEAMSDAVTDPTKWENLGIDGKEAEELDKRFDSLRIERDRREKDAEEDHKKVIEQNDYDTILAFDMKEITLDDVRKLADKRKISVETYKNIRGLSEKQSKEKVTENNALVAGSLAEDIAMGRDVRKDLTAAYLRGDLKEETYRGFRTAIANKEYSMAYKQLLALKPGEFEKYDPDKNMRFNEAVELFQLKVSEEMPPAEAADYVLGLYDVKRTAHTLRRPQQLKGEKTDMDALNAATDATIALYTNEEMSPEEYAAEIKLIEQLKELARNRMDIPELTDADKARLKKAKRQ